MQTQLEQVPPNDRQAEMALLGSMMLDRVAAGEMLELVKDEDFYYPPNRTVCQTIRRMISDSVPIDLVTVCHALKDAAKLNEVGDEPYLAELAMSVPSAANADRYAMIVRDRAMQRNFIATCGGLIRECYEAAGGVSAFVESAEHRLMETMVSRRSSAPVAMRDALQELFEHLGKGEGLGGGLSTGYIELDDMLRLGRGNFILLGARPSIGKSACALGTVIQNSVYDGKKVALFSLEMNQRELSARLLSHDSGIPFSRIVKPGVVLTNEENTSVQASAQRLMAGSLVIDHEAEQGVNGIRSKCRRLKAASGLDLVVIDYVQLIQQPGRAESRRVEVDDISRGLKLMARELDIPVLALCQLNRDVDKTEREPRLSDLRESGGLEQDADAVIMLHRPDKDNAEKNNDLTEEALLLVRKNRNGPTGRVTVQWQGQCMRFCAPTWHRMAAPNL